MPGASVGPFTYLRPGTVLGETGKIGAFYETKNVTIGRGSKLSHLGYAGDAEIGENTNIGCGNITANYDGEKKHRTVIGSGVRTGSNTVFVAPVQVGDGAYSGAGAVIRKDVPGRCPGHVTVRQAAQRRKAGSRRNRPGSVSAALAEAAGATPTSSTYSGTDRRGLAIMSEITAHGEKKLVLAAGRAHPELAQEIAKELGTELLPLDAYDFANGEIYVRAGESVRGTDAFVIQAHPAPLNNWLMEQLIMIDSLKRASAKRITVVSPFYPYARQDKKGRGREPISARLVADLYKTAGADRIMSVDLHTSQIQGFFDGPVDHLMAIPLLADYIRTRVGSRQHHRRLPGHRPRPRRRAVGRTPRRRAAGLRAQEPRPHRAQPGGLQDRRGPDRGPHLRPDRRHDRHRRNHLRRRPGAQERRRQGCHHRRDPRRVLRSGRPQRLVRIRRPRSRGHQHPADRRRASTSRSSPCCPSRR